MDRQTVRPGFPLPRLRSPASARCAAGLAVGLLWACDPSGERAPGGAEISFDPSLMGPSELDAGTDASDGASDATPATEDGSLAAEGGNDGAPGDDAAAQESANQERERLLIADTSQPVLYAYDVQEGALLATLSVPGDVQLSAGSTGRFAYLKQASQLAAVDLGLTQRESSQGLQYELGPVQLLSQVVTGATPGAVHAQAGKLALFLEGDGSVQLFEESALLGTLDPLTIDAGQPHPGLAVPWAGKLLISTLQAGQAQSQLQRFGATGLPELALDCLAPTAAGHNQVALAVACQTGLLRFAAGETVPQAFAYPEALAAPVTRLVAHPFAASFLALAGDQLCSLHDQLSCVAAPAEPLALSFDSSGKRALVLTRAGLLHLFDAQSLTAQGSFRVTSAVEGSASARELPGMAVGKRMLFVSDPATRQVHEIHVASQSVQADHPLPGAPGQLLLLGYPDTTR